MTAGGDSILTARGAQTRILKPTRGWGGLNLGELWQFRELFFFLVWRDIKVRYKQTILGFSWAVLQPFTTMIVFSLFFGGLANIPSDGVPYPVFSYAALVPWAFFANALSNASNSLVSGAALVRRIYFPRLVLPLAAVLSGIVDFLLAFAVLLVMMLFFGIVPTLNVVFLPLFLLLALVTALGVSLWLAAMNVQFRDVRYIIPFITQLWLFITPIAYPSSLIADPTLRALYGVNPMVGVVEGFRWALLGAQTQTADALPTLLDPSAWALTTPAAGSAAPDASILVSALVALVLLVSGVVYFRRMEKIFADVM